MVLTQEEAESSVLCEDTSVAHPKVDKVDVIALRITPLKAIFKHFKKMFFKILLLLIKVAIDDDLKPPVKSWNYAPCFVSFKSPCFSLSTGG